MLRVGDYIEITPMPDFCHEISSPKIPWRARVMAIDSWSLNPRVRMDQEELRRILKDPDAQCTPSFIANQRGKRNGWGLSHLRQTWTVVGGRVRINGMEVELSPENTATK